MKLLAYIAIGIFGWIVMSSIFQAIFFPESIIEKPNIELNSVDQGIMDTLSRAKFDPYWGLNDRQKLESIIAWLKSFSNADTTELKKLRSRVNELNDVAMKLDCIPDSDSLAKMKTEAKLILSKIQSN